MFYFAERQNPQRAMPKHMETRLSKAQWYVLLCRMTEASCETLMFDVQVAFPTFGRSRCFRDAPRENTTFD